MSEVPLYRTVSPDEQVVSTQTNLSHRLCEGSIIQDGTLSRVPLSLSLSLSFSLSLLLSLYLSLSLSVPCAISSLSLPCAISWTLPRVPPSLSLSLSPSLSMSRVS